MWELFFHRWVGYSFQVTIIEIPRYTKSNEYHLGILEGLNLNLPSVLGLLCSILKVALFTLPLPAIIFHSSHTTTTILSTLLDAIWWLDYLLIRQNSYLKRIPEWSGEEKNNNVWVVRQHRLSYILYSLCGVFLTCGKLRATCYMNSKFSWN